MTTSPLIKWRIFSGYSHDLGHIQMVIECHMIVDMVIMMDFRGPHFQIKPYAPRIFIDFSTTSCRDVTGNDGASQGKAGKA